METWIHDKIVRLESAEIINEALEVYQTSL